MADEQPYTDAQLSDGTTLRFMGQIGPDEVRQKVHSFRTKQGAQSIAANPPGIPRPQLNMQADMGDAGGKLKGLPGMNPHTPTFQEAKGDVGLAALPLAATMSLPQIVGSAVGGAAGQYGGKRLAQAMNMGDTGQEIAGDVGGLAGGAAGGWGAGELSDAVSPNLGAKVKAFGKLAGREAISHIPVAGRVVRRPSFGDVWDAATAKAPEPEPVFPKTQQGPDTPPNEYFQARGLGRPPVTDPAAGLGDIPVAQSRLVDQMSTPAPSAASREPWATIRAQGLRPGGLARIPTPKLVDQMMQGTTEAEPFPTEDTAAVPKLSEQIKASNAAPEKLSRPVTENPVVGSLVRAMQKSGMPIADRPNLMLKGSGRVNRVMGPEEDLTDILGKSLRKAKRGGDTPPATSEPLAAD